MRRPRTSYGQKLVVGHVLLVIAVVLVVVLSIDRALARDLLQDLDARLEAQAHGAAAWTTEGRHPDRLAARLGGIVGARVTILDAGGRVIGDSDTSVPLGFDESREPEVAAAGARGPGRASRSWNGVETRYLAVTTERGMMLRLGASLAPIQATIQRVRTRLGVASAIGVVLALALAYGASQIAAKPLRTMRDAAQRIAEGDYSVKLAGKSPDEFGELERSLSVLAARLAADRTRIERLETTRRDFVANVSHELRTPVTAIQGYAETLLRGTADPETARRFLETMHRQAQRISALVTDLLRLSGLEAQAFEESPREVVMLGEVVREIAATARESRSESAEILVDVKSDLAVMGDPRGVEQIVENLVENAIRYGARTVRLSASTSEGRALLFVDDDGPGIAAEHLPRLFERFYRIESAPRALAGTGLGLAIVKHLAESMGGSVRVESELGKGTKFTVELGLRDSSGVSS